MRANSCEKDTKKLELRFAIIQGDFVHLQSLIAPVAQLDRAPHYG